MKRKVALLQVLVPHAPLLILDEPTNTLDPDHARRAAGAACGRRGDRGQAVLFSSHVLSEVEQVCDRVGILQQGRLVHLQDMAELRQARRIRVRFAGQPPQPPAMQHLQVRERLGDSLTLEYRGELPQLLAGWPASPSSIFTSSRWGWRRFTTSTTETQHERDPGS